MAAASLRRPDEVLPPSPQVAIGHERATGRILMAAAAFGALTAWRGMSDTPIPTAVDAGSATIPIWRLLAMGAAVLPVLALHSHLAGLEEVATRRFWRHQRLYLSGMCLACLVIYLSIAAITVHPLVLLAIARSWLAWLGLALVAGALLGWRLAWTLPAIMSAIMVYWGYQGGGEYHWWEFSARPPDDLPSALLILSMLAAGLVAYWATPWRRWRLAFFRHR